jgi:type II secretory ATPase GspE/PulE/Tfp pilus assembly ATPase PilB-like protein
MAIVWIAKLVDRAIDQAASDIHLEFLDDFPAQLKVRVRIAGVLRPWEGLEGAQAKAVVSRIKAIAQVGSGQVRKVEEGRYLHRRGSGGLNDQIDQGEWDTLAKSLPRVDLRLGVLPTVLGEKHILRLPSLAEIPRIPQLGFSEHNLRLVAHLFAKPNGLILFAGPMGAGKSTSLRAAVQYLGGPERAVASVEDPVEQHMPDVDQIEVNEPAGNTFGSILRTIRRADVQVLMIGEIRDGETALSALEIALAGSRVVSSIHANDSIAAVEALQDLSGANALRVTQALRGIVSQRLVKRVHAECRGTGKLADGVSPCLGCDGTGVDGRLAIHEVLPITSEFARAFANGVHRSELENLARDAGMVTLREDAQRRLASGETTERWVAEVLGGE